VLRCAARRGSRPDSWQITGHKSGANVVRIRAARVPRSAQAGAEIMTHV
jgi:hypothetical protein